MHREEVMKKGCIRIRRVPGHVPESAGKPHIDFKERHNGKNRPTKDYLDSFMSEIISTPFDEINTPGQDWNHKRQRADNHIEHQRRGRAKKAFSHNISYCFWPRAKPESAVR